MSRHLHVYLASCALVLLASWQALAQPGAGRWELQKSGSDDDLQSVAFTTDTTGVAVGKNGTILKTADAGKSWKRVVPRDTKGPNFGQILFANAQEGWAISDIVNYILHTTDGGDTWAPVPLPGPKGVFGLSGSHHCTHAFVEGSYFYLVWGLSGTHLYQSSNAGRAWTELNKTIDLDKLSGNSLSFPDLKHGCYVSARKTPAEYYSAISSDGGKIWVEQRLKGNLKGNYLRTHFVNKDLGWMIPQFGDIHFSNDGGKSWTPQQLGHHPNDILLTLHFLDEKTGHVLCKGKNEVRRTTDAGKSWRSLGSIKLDEHLTAMSFPSTRHGYVVGHKGLIAHYEEANRK